MPFGGNDWLALTQEPTLEPEIPICDPHHHFWDRRPARRVLLGGRRSVGVEAWGGNSSVGDAVLTLTV